MVAAKHPGSGAAGAGGGIGRVGLLLWGIKSAFTSGTFEALLYDELKASGQAADYTRIYGRARAFDSGGAFMAALGAAVAVRFGYPITLAASVAAGGVAFLAAASLPPAPPAIAVRAHSYLVHLRLGLAGLAREPAVMSILLFSAVILALGVALQEFWSIFGAKVGLTRPVIALFVGAQTLTEALVSLIAYRLAGLPTRGFYALLAVCGLLLATAAGLFTPAAMLLLALYSGLMKLIGVVFEGRLQHIITSDRRATIGSVKSFLAQIGFITLYLSFGPLAQATSYRIAFLACGFAGVAIGLTYLALPRPQRD